ncbi:MAG: MFS transporter [Piscinibacter sp.]|uniref:MFS transporter n=1 Tax=Piscinibacter sp. TaxID=1903157 RepID=UPI00258EB8FD|nr:MFS transporter [Piscinibacter sp.]MCW5662547.1 MFS transporter [Piscinibacter sp.]
MPGARAAITAVFFAFALPIGLWAGAIPALLRQSGSDGRQLGIALTLHTAAYIGAMAAGGQLARRIAPRRLVLAALGLVALAFPLLYAAGSPLMLTLALIGTGASGGLLDLAMNTEGTALERRLGRPILLSMHAAASLAFALGAFGGSLVATQAGPLWLVLPVWAVFAPVAWWLARLAPAPEPAPLTVAARPRRVERGRGVGLIGLLLGLCIGAEIAAQMWSASFLERQARELAAFAGAGAAFFAGCQALTRLVGDRLRHAFGDRRVITGSLLIGVAGYALVAGVPGFAAGVLGFALVGFGTACVVPCCFALLARDPERASAALGSASLVAGLIRLPTPLYLGFVAAAWGEEVAFAGIAAGLAAGALLAQRGLRALD